MKINIYFLILVIYFFFNNIFLPQPLLYTILLSPFFIAWLVKVNEGIKIIYYFFYISPFITIHFVNNDINAKSYIISFIYLLSVYIQIITLHQIIRKNKIQEAYFIKIIWINLILTLTALFLFITPYKNLMWITNDLSIGEYSRLKLFTYEPSYYSTLIAPLFFYNLFLYIQERKYKFLFLTILISLILSFSFGVIASIAGTLTLLLIFRAFFFLRKKVIILMLIISLPIILLAFISDNPFSQRMQKILSGEDTSGNGRVIGSTIVSIEVAQRTNPYFGAGLGQSKHIMFGSDLVKEQSWNDDQRIINAVGDTIVTFGYTGLIIRFLIEFLLFFRFKVYLNMFRLSLFIWIFIYQFTGSFLTNIVEYFTWALAFSNIFPKFNFKKPLIKTKKTFENGKKSRF